MEIRFVSSLTADDEDVFAAALVKAVGAILDQMPIAYTIRIATAGARVYQHTHPGVPRSPGDTPEVVAAPEPREARFGAGDVDVHPQTPRGRDQWP